jgi:hypothetical protein
MTSLFDAAPVSRSQTKIARCETLDIGARSLRDVDSKLLALSRQANVSCRVHERFSGTTWDMIDTDDGFCRTDRDIRTRRTVSKSRDKRQFLITHKSGNDGRFQKHNLHVLPLRSPAAAAAAAAAATVSTFREAEKLQFPRLSHHQNEVLVVVYRGTDTAVVVDEFFTRHLHERIAKKTHK